MTRGWSLIFSNSILHADQKAFVHGLCCSNWCLPAETTVPRNCQQAGPSRAPTGPLKQSPSGSTGTDTPRSKCECRTVECWEWQECWVPSWILITFYVYEHDYHSLKSTRLWTWWEKNGYRRHVSTMEPLQIALTWTSHVKPTAINYKLWHVAILKQKWLYV